MNVTLFHGSENVIPQPAFGKGRLSNDYGRGFYCTQSLELAKEWACGNNHDGFANEYILSTNELSILNLNDSKYTILNWLALLTKHRTYWQNSSISATAKNYLQENFSIDTTPYDIIIGNRADDSYFSFAQDFVSNAISYKKLKNAMHLGKLGEQIVLISERAFEQISFIKAHPSSSEIYYGKKILRDKSARKEYRLSKENEDTILDLFMLDIMREGIQNDDARLR